mgnify:FL=1
MVMLTKIILYTMTFSVIMVTVLSILTGLFLPMVLVAAYAFLSIHLDGLSVLDFLSFVVSFYITEQQIFEWEDPT